LRPLCIFVNISLFSPSVIGTSPSLRSRLTLSSRARPSRPSGGHLATACITARGEAVTEILMNNELEALAEILAEWIDSAPAIPTVYLFGSRVRGDHRPDSDVDIRTISRRVE
jgi:hypothetical protein